MDSIRTQVGMLAMITSQTDEITRQSEVIKIQMNIQVYFNLNKLNN